MNQPHAFQWMCYSSVECTQNWLSMTQYFVDTVAVGCSIRMRVSQKKIPMFFLPAYNRLSCIFIQFYTLVFPNHDNGSKDVGSLTLDVTVNPCESSLAPLSAVLIRYEVLAILRSPERDLCVKPTRPRTKMMRHTPSHQIHLFSLNSLAMAWI